jgi:3-deoxy-D-manno-octulosonic-acid transferase
VIRRLYSLLWALALGPAWTWWAWRTRGTAGAGEQGRWRERLAWLEYPPQAQDGLLVHAASIGESVAAVALLRELQPLVPGLRLLVTCTSFTGAQRLRRDLGEAVPQAFLPFDTPGAMARLLDRARPRAIVLMETELWPNLLAAARERAIPVVLANARLSARSARGYARLAALSRPMLAGLHTVLAQSRPIAQRFRVLGVPAERLQVTGNIKSDLQVPDSARGQAAAWRQRIGPRPVLVAGSTHPGEDEALLAAWPQVLQAHPRALLVLVPRHPQRFDEVARLIAQHGHPVLRHSQRQAPEGNQADASVWLGDTLGEMLAWLALADLAFIGGSLIPRGGHSPLEAMVLACPITSGRQVHNFDQAYRALALAGGVQWLDSVQPQAIANPLNRLLADAAARLALGAAGRRVFDAGAGAARRSAQAIAALLRKGAGAVQRCDDGRTATWINTSVTPPLPADPFDAEAWRQRGAWQATVGGRGSAGFIAHGEAGLVLRHYRRGGLVARWLHDSYAGRRAHRSRAMREFALLSRLRHVGLDVPEALAARMQRTGVGFYRADLLIARIPGARSLAEHLAGGVRPSPAQWHAMGAAIRRLHDQGVDHVDLNAHNLLLAPDGRVWIIDFDRCRERPGQAWKARNLARLQRSLHKLRAQQAGFAYADADWPALLHGYRAPDTAAAAPPDSRRAT